MPECNDTASPADLVPAPVIDIQMVRAREDASYCALRELSARLLLRQAVVYAPKDLPQSACNIMHLHFCMLSALRIPSSSVGSPSRASPIFIENGRVMARSQTVNEMKPLC